MQPSNDQAIFYFKFVDAAYAMYEADPNDWRPPAKDFPDTNYEILTYLTSIDPASGSRVFFGFIAADGEPNSDRPGILAIRGTDNWCEWLTDLDATPVPFPPFDRYTSANVAKGFDEFLNGIKWITADGKEVDVPVTLAQDWPAGLVIAGHSLGGALATLLTASWLAAIPSLLVNLVTAACPACGDDNFVTQFDNLAGDNSWRYINVLDGVASALDLFYDQVANGYWLYPYDIVPTLACEHSLDTYIYLLSPPGTPCTSDCCIVDVETREQVKRLVDGRRAALERTG